MPTTERRKTKRLGLAFFAIALAFLAIAISGEKSFYPVAAAFAAAAAVHMRKARRE